jgi:predicted RNA-binding Zn ribbon-like protein
LLGGQLERQGRRGPFGERRDRQRHLDQLGGVLVEAPLVTLPPTQRFAAVEVTSGAERLASDELDRVKICEGVDHKSCTWLFLDTPKNRSRRWCSVKDCGDRAKARRHYERAKST